LRESALGPAQPRPPPHCPAKHLHHSSALAPHGVRSRAHFLTPPEPCSQSQLVSRRAGPGPHRDLGTGPGSRHFRRPAPRRGGRPRGWPRRGPGGGGRAGLDRDAAQRAKGERRGWVDGECFSASHGPALARFSPTLLRRGRPQTLKRRIRQCDANAAHPRCSAHANIPILLLSSSWPC